MTTSWVLKVSALLTICDGNRRWIPLTKGRQCPSPIFLCCSPECISLNSSPPSAAYMRRWTGLSLVQVMACRLLGAKPLPEPILAYCQLDSWEHISVKFESEFYHFHSRKCNWNYRLPKWRPFCPRGDELNKLSCSRGFEKLCLSCGVIVMGVYYVIYVNTNNKRLRGEFWVCANMGKTN